MKATYFYNRKLIGDVLLIVIDNEAQATHIETKDDKKVWYYPKEYFKQDECTACSLGQALKNTQNNIMCYLALSIHN